MDKEKAQKSSKNTPVSLFGEKIINDQIEIKRIKRIRKESTIIPPIHTNK